MAVNLIDNEEIHVNQDGSDITLEIQADALKNDNVVVGSIRTKNMLSPSNIISGIYTVGDGTYSSTSSGCCTARKIEIDNTKDYILTTGNTSGAFNIYAMFYNASGTYLDYINVASNQSLRLSTFSNYSNAKYINLRFDVAISGLNKPQFEEGTVATAYSPYQNLTGEENYSTGEQVIGTWINGKPLYRKTLYFASNGGGTSEVSYTLSNYGITNVDTIFITHPSFYSNNFNGYRNPFQYYDGNKFSCGVNATTLNVTLGYAPISSSPFVITLEYTKTTD